jgi:hypothetical protein
MGTIDEGIRRHEPDRVVVLFTHGVLFQGFDPDPGLGRAPVVAYCTKQPVGLSPEYKLLSVRDLGDGTMVIYAHVVLPALAAKPVRTGGLSVISPRWRRHTAPLQ